MDKSKGPGIVLERVHLLECTVGSVKSDVPLSFNLGITSFSRTIVADGKLLEVIVGFDLMKGITNPACRFTCTFAGTYTRSPDSNMTWEEFKDHISVAHLVPFVREFISNVTTRMPLSTLLLPPQNTSELLKEFQQPLPTEAKG